MPQTFTPIPQSTEKADLLLINPDFSKNELGVSSPPENHLGLNRLAGYLADKGHIVQVLDTTGRESSQTGPEELSDWLSNNLERYQSIGFHTNSWNINHILRIIDKIRPNLGDKKVLFGGPLPSSEPKKTTELIIKHGLKNIGVVQGFGEHITDAILSNPNLKSADGLWTFEGGELIAGRKMSMTEEQYEHLPFLSLEHNTFYQNYYKPVIESGDLGQYSMEIIFGSQGLEVNRGCPFNCTYCSVPQYERGLIKFSPKRVIDELEYLATEAGFFMFTFTNSNIMFYQREWMVEFCEEILRRKMESYLNWTAYHHPSIVAKLDVKDFDLMKRAGTDTIVFGVQSFEEKILKTFLRPLDTPELTRTIRQKTAKSGQQITIDYITGVPGEDLDIIEQAFDYFSENDIECRNYQLKFYPNTKLPTMKMDMSNHDLVPITGDLAPELEAYAVIPKNSNPRAAQLDAKIRKHNADLTARRPVRFGKYYVQNADQAKKLLEVKIPNDKNIPDKVKRAMTIALKEMLSPKKRKTTLADLNPDEMMKVVVMADPDSPPMVLAMQEKLRNELGEGKFQELRAKYENAGL